MAKMTERKHINAIKKKMEKLGTLRDEFDPIIERTAQKYVMREEIVEQFRKSGGNAIVMHTNQGGKTNAAKNPYLTALNEIDEQIVVCERELGLTPAALKKINDQALKKKKASPLEELLGSMK